MSTDDDFIEDTGDDVTFSPQDGFAAILIAASACDEHIADEESQALTTILARMKLYSSLSPTQFGSMMDRLFGLLDQDGVEELTAKAVAAVPRSLRETAFVNAVDIILADRIIEDDEQRFIDTLQGLLEMSSPKAAMIFDVMTKKNSG